MKVYVKKSLTLRHRLLGLRQDIWMLFALLSVMTSFTIVTFLAFFDTRIHGNLPAIVLIYVCDLIFSIDLVWRIKVFHQFKSKTNMKRRVVLNQTLLFILDFISLIPFEALVMIKSVTPMSRDKIYLFIFANLRLNRVLRITQIFHYYFGKTNELRLNLYKRELFALFLCCICTLVTVFHGFACLWYRISCEPTWRNWAPHCKADNISPVNASGPGANSTFLEGHPYYTHIKRTQGDSFGWYVGSLHWTVMSLRNSGSRYTPPSTAIDMLVSSLVMMFGTTVSMAIIAVLIYFLTEMDLRRSIFFHEAYAVKSFVKHFDMTRTVARYTDSCFNFMWRRERGYSDIAMRNILPKTVQAEIAMCMIQRMVDTSEILRLFPVDGLESISLASNLKHYFANEFLIRPNTVVHQCYYILTGKVEVLSEVDGITPILVLSKGSLLGETNLIYPNVRKHGVITRTPCDIITLHNGFLANLLKKYPQVDRKIRALLRARVNWIKTKEAMEKTGVDDLDDQDNLNKLQSEVSRATTETWMNMAGKGIGSSASKPSTYSSFQRRTGIQFMSVLTWLALAKTRWKKALGNNYPNMYEQLQYKYRNLASNRLYVIGELDPEPLFYGKKFLVSKASSVYWSWKMFVLAVIVFHVFAAPLQLAINDSWFSYPVNVFIDVVYILDLIFRLCVFVSADDMTPEITFWSHFKRSLLRPWTIVDIIPVLPLYAIAEVTQLSLRQRNLCRIPQCVKFFRVILFFTRLENDVRVKIFYIRFFKNSFYLTWYIYTLACVLVASGCDLHFPGCKSSSGETWVPQTPQELYKFDIATDSVFLLALYWSICTTFGIGFNDISLKTKEETAIHSLGLLVSFILISYFYADLTSTLSGALENAIHHQDNVIWLTRYLDEALIDLRLIDRVSVYLNVQWQVLRGISSEAHRSVGFLTVSHSMYIELVIDYVAEYLYKTSIFRHLDTDTMRKFCLAGKLAVVPPNETIINSGDFIRRMYIIRRGYAQIFYGDSNIGMSTLTSGNSFGEINMLFGLPSQVTVVSMTYLEVIVIDNANFDKILPSARFFGEAIEALKNDIPGLWRFQRSLLAPTLGGGRMDLANEDNNRRREPRRHRFTPPLISSTYVYRKKVKNSRGQVINVAKLGIDPFATEFKRLGCCRCLRLCFCRCTFLPRGLFIRLWEFVRVFVIIVIAVLVPVVEAFPNLKIRVQYFIIAFDCFAGVDMILRFQTAYKNPVTNENITHPLRTTKYYLTTAFLADLLASYPVYAAIYYSSRHTEYEDVLWIYLLKCNRLILLYRLWRLYQRIDFKIVKGKTTWKLFKLVPILLFLTHIFACISAVASCPATFKNPSPATSCSNDTWIGSSDAPAMKSSRTVEDIELYIISFYYTATSAMGCGFGDYHPYSQSERITISVLFVLYICLKAYIIAHIVGTKCHLDHKLLGYQKQMSYLVGFLGRECFDPRLSSRIIRYYDYQWRRTRGIEPQKLFANLFPSLRKEVAMDVFEDVMRQLPAFNEVPSSFLRTICVYLTPIYFLRNDIIVQKGDVCDYILFISRGKVIQWTEEGEITLDVGNYIGTMDVASVRPTYRYTTCALTNVDIFGIRRKDFARTVNFYPSIAQRFHEVHQDDAATQTQDAEDRRQNVVVNSDVRTGETTSAGTGNSFNSLSTGSNAAVVNQRTVSLENLRNSFSEVVTYVLEQRTSDKPREEDLMLASSFLPRSRVHRYLALSTLVAAVISTVCVTYQASFKRYDPAGFVIGYLLDVIYIIRMYLSFRVSYFDATGEIITDRAEIQNKYLSDFQGFGLDFLSTVPLEIFVGATALSATSTDKEEEEKKRAELYRLWACLRLNRVLRLIHVWAFFERRTNSLIRSLIKTKIERIICFTLLYFHLVICLLHAISREGTFTATSKCEKGTEPYQKKWACADPERWFQTKGNTDKPFETAPYSWTTFFVLSTFTTTAYGDLLPVTIFEMLFVSFLAFSSFLWLCFVLSDILSGLQNTMDTSFHLAADVVLRLYVDYGVSHVVLDKVKRYFTYAWGQNNGVVVPEFLIRAPTCLKMDIYSSIYGTHLRSSYVFAKLPEEFIRQASIRLRQFWVLAGDYVIRQNEIDSNMYFIHRGYVEYTEESRGDDGAVVDLGYLGKSALFGEYQCIMGAEPHRRSYKAQVNVDVVSLSPTDIKELFDLFPQHKDIITERVVEKRKLDAATLLPRGSELLDAGQSNLMLAQWRVRNSIIRQAEEDTIAEFGNDDLVD